MKKYLFLLILFSFNVNSASLYNFDIQYFNVNKNLALADWKGTTLEIEVLNNEIKGNINWVMNNNSLGKYSVLGHKNKDDLIFSSLGQIPEMPLQIFRGKNYDAVLLGRLDTLGSKSDATGFWKATLVPVPESFILFLSSVGILLLIKRNKNEQRRIY